jgi:hypothetical protein
MLVESAAVAFEVPDVVIEQRSERRREDVVERAVITFRGQDYPVTVVNISSRGTMIESDLLPRLGESLTIRFENCSRIHGFVRWMRGGQLGIRFGHEIILAS